VKQRYRTLTDYLEQTGTSQGELAARLHVSAPYVSLMCSRKRAPGRRLALRIEKILGVPIESWDDEPVTK
jgi:plasmid maintenance system antidote protein VapI